MFGRPKHHHAWRKEAATYAPPYDDATSYNDPSAEDQAMFTGITEVLLICSTCGEFEVVSMAGKPIDKALAELVGIVETS